MLVMTEARAEEKQAEAEAKQAEAEAKQADEMGVGVEKKAEAK